MLPEECLNGQGWLVDKLGGSWVDLSNGEHYSETVALEMELDETGTLTGKADNIYESYDAWMVRKICSLQGTEAYRDYMQSVNSKWKISDLQLENLEEPEAPVIEKISLTIPDASDKGDGIMYLNPILCGRMESNEFYAEERISVIDLACPSVKKYTCTITIPEGWTVAELPQSVNLANGWRRSRVHLQHHLRRQKGQHLSRRSDFPPSIFLPERYASIRKFYSEIIRKQSEVIILKKEI